VLLGTLNPVRLKMFVNSTRISRLAFSLIRILAQAHALDRMALLPVVAVVGVCRAELPVGRICPRRRIEDERLVGIETVTIKMTVNGDTPGTRFTRVVWKTSVLRFVVAAGVAKGNPLAYFKIAP
jgi:hypothetical protein